jgi:hypothetical protein
LLLCLRSAPPWSRLPASQRSLKSIGPIPPPATTACRGLGLLPAWLCLGPSRVEARSICRLPARLHQGPGRMPGQPFSPPLHVCTFPCRLPATSRLLRSYLPRLGSSHSQPSLSDQLIGRWECEIQILFCFFFVLNIQWLWLSDFSSSFAYLGCCICS